MMKLPFTFEQTEEVRAAHCARVTQGNLARALEAVLTAVETKVLFTNETKVEMDFTNIAQKYNIGAYKSGMPDGSTPMLVFPSVREELIAKIREGFPTSVVTLEMRPSEWKGGKDKEWLTIDWTPPLTLDEPLLCCDCGSAIPGDHRLCFLRGLENGAFETEDGWMKACRQYTKGVRA